MDTVPSVTAHGRKRIRELIRRMGLIRGRVSLISLNRFQSEKCLLYDVAVLFLMCLKYCK